MDERPLNPQDSDWRDILQFTQIFRAFRIAIRPSKLLLALAALLLMYAGGRLLDVMWPQKFIDQGYMVRQDVQTIFTTVSPPFAAFAHSQINNFEFLTANVLSGDWSFPGGAPGATARFVLQTPLEYWLGNKVFFSILFAWFLVVWALFGGAIARIAAIHVARDEVISPIRAMKFSAKAFPSFVASPLIPFIMVLVLGVIVSILGLLLYIPYVGPVAAGLILIVPLVLGILMMLLTVGCIAGSGLMYPTIATEGSDAFDAVSRALSHVFAAPWRLLFYAAVALAYGAITYFFVRVCVFVVLWLVHFFMGWFLAGDANAIWMTMWPTPSLEKMAYSPDWTALNAGGDIGAAIASFWIYLTISLMGAYVISFYFSASTIIYLLMRRKVDAAAMDQVYLEPADDVLPDTAEEGAIAPKSPAPASPTTDTPGTAAGQPPQPNA